MLAARDGSANAAVAGELPSPVIRARERLRATTPAWYRWWKHVLLIAAFTLVGVFLAISQLEEISAGGWLFFAGTLVFLNFGEYATHRWNMHQLRLPRAVHHRHVAEHHAFFTAASMGVDGIEDLRWVLFPPWALPLLVASVSPLFLLLWVAAPAGWAWLYLLAVIVYYGIYEALHTLAHLPPAHPVGGHPVVRALTRHHRVHHDPGLMNRWNFNFVMPLFDYVLGTAHPGGRRRPAAAEPQTGSNPSPGRQGPPARSSGDQQVEIGARPASLPACSHD